MFQRIKHLLFGSPIPNARAHQERLRKLIALPVFASDPISSVGYATEEILLALSVAGVAVASYSNMSIYLCAAIIALLIVVVTSYRQTIFAYPNGGGSYIVAKENLGTLPGLFAGSSLMIDYVLTVAVSVSSGVAAILSFAPHEWHDHRVAISVAVIGFITLANLRGLRESGTFFALPTYTFVASALALIAMGVYQITSEPGFIIPPPPEHTLPEVTHAGASGILFAFLVLRAFASGCCAMTGTEAISDGIPSFRKPESRNAAFTLTVMAGLLVVIFSGITFIAWKGHVVPMDQNSRGYQTVLSQIASAVAGRSWFYYLFQGATAGILVLAANTGFADFPRLGSIMARDRFLPRQLYNQGDRLVFQNGIVLLASLAALLIVVFHGEVNALIPLYAVGVFLSFTLSQWGMSRRAVRLKQPGWQRRSLISGIGAVVTGIVVIVQGVTKASEGAWIVLILIPSLVYLFARINKHYVSLGNELRLNAGDRLPEIQNTVLVLTPSLHRGVLPALAYAKGLSSDVRAVHIDTDPIDANLLRDRWDTWGGGMPLVILDSPYRALVDPLLQYIDVLRNEKPGQTVTVVIPEFVTGRWWHRLLHNQSGLLLKMVLMFQEGVITTNVRYHVGKSV